MIRKAIGIKKIYEILYDIYCGYCGINKACCFASRVAQWPPQTRRCKLPGSPPQLHAETSCAEQCGIPRVKMWARLKTSENMVFITCSLMNCETLSGKNGTLYLHPCMHACIHTYIDTYIDTCIIMHTRHSSCMY